MTQTQAKPSTKAKPMRESMPSTAAFIDGLRNAFGKEGIDQAIRSGMAGRKGFFYAEENGQAVGTQWREFSNTTMKGK